MAKNVIICVLFVGLIGSLVFGLFKASRADDHETVIKEAKRDVRAAQAQRDSLQVRLKASRDSVDLVLTIAMNFKTDSRKAEIAAQQAQKQNEHEKANFTSYPTDSVRLRELARFVPSILSYRHDHLETEDRGKLR